jgi:NhaA family Na+:H+ antiporter
VALGGSTARRVAADLIAITIIAALYTAKLNLLSLLAAIALIALYGALQARGKGSRSIRTPWIHVPIAVLAWYLIHDSGVHATVAGVALGVIAALVVGKFVGVLGGAWTATRLGIARLGEELHWRDLAGVGFTVSLLIGDLAYAGTSRFERVTTAVLGASLIASVSAAVTFRIRGRRRVRGVDETGDAGHARTGSDEPAQGRRRTT